MTKKYYRITYAGSYTQRIEVYPATWVIVDGNIAQVKPTGCSRPEYLKMREDIFETLEGAKAKWRATINEEIDDLRYDILDAQNTLSTGPVIKDFNGRK